ncbi:MAG: hypothetical protein OSJ27_03275 [Candidatus Gastranaerophilales bacterium]|nr:hypothetical protein [Candidatus Gastranaerophilales bacterium]
MASVSFGSMFNPEKTHRRHVEGKLINPEYNIERLNAHQDSRFGKLSPEEPEAKAVSTALTGVGSTHSDNPPVPRFGADDKLDFDLETRALLGRSQVKIPTLPNRDE